MVRAPVTSQAMLWIGGASVCYGLLALVQSADAGLWTLCWCTLGVLLLALGADTRRLWRVGDAVKTGAIVGGSLAFACIAVGGRPVIAAITVAASIAAAAIFAGFLAWSDRRIVTAMVRARLAGRPIEPFAIAAVATGRRIVFEVAYRVAAWERFDVLEQLARNTSVPDAESLRRYYLALALYSRGRLAEATELVKTTNHIDQGPHVQDRWEQLVARIQISDGEAAAVLASFPIESRVGQTVDRTLIIADAHAVAGNLAEARTLVKGISDQVGNAFLERLRASTRPTSTIATSLLAAAESPYR